MKPEGWLTPQERSEALLLLKAGEMSPLSSWKVLESHAAADKLLRECRDDFQALYDDLEYCNCEVYTKPFKCPYCIAGAALSKLREVLPQ